MKIIVEPEGLHQSRRLGSITSPIYFRDESKYFPEKGWSDFTVVILSAWLFYLNKPATIGQITLLNFMDGPYLLRATQINGTELRIEFVCNRKDEVVEIKIVMEKAVFLSQLLSASKTVLSACNSRNWSSPDLSSLSKAIDGCTTH